METINNRDELLSLIKKDFDYLKAEDFQIVNVEMPNSMSWAVTFDGKCRIRIEWNWHDGVFIYASKSEKLDYKILKGYAIEILVYFLMGRKIVEQYYDLTNMENRLDNLKLYSQFFKTHLDKIVEFVSSDQFEKQNIQIQQARQSLIDLEMQRSRENRF